MMHTTTLNEVEALSILTATQRLGSIKIRVLLHHFGSALDALEAPKEEIAAIPGIHPDTISHWGWWNKSRTWADNLTLAEKYGVELLPFTSPAYPKRLLELTDHPILLYIKGTLLGSDAQSLGVVGTRNCTIYGGEIADKISEDLAYQGFTVVSGLARGIDAFAHQGALKSGRTIGVIGSGLANIYPREHDRLAGAICERGALISEFPMTTPPDRQNFPQRNRIVSALTLGTVLIEAPIKSGAMLTMERAWQQGRKLFALPGRVDMETFKGNHQLIKEGKAQLVENGRDIANSFFNLFEMNRIEKKDNQPLISLESEEIDLLNQLPNVELSIEEIIQQTKLPVVKLNILLMSLVLKQMIKEYPGKIYKKGSNFGELSQCQKNR